MNILVVGNVIKDVYLNLNVTTDTFETDKHHTKWLSLSFDASEHQFFSRKSSLGGAAVTLEVLTNLGLKSAITNSDLKFTPEEGLSSSLPISTHRYILIADENSCYFAPSTHQTTVFDTPSDFYDYIYIDRSANLGQNSINRIKSYLDFSRNTKLIIYLENSNDRTLNQLIPSANLIFCEKNTNASMNKKTLSELNIPSEKVIYISEKQLSYLNINESVSPNRIDLMTHLSFYSIASATILGCFILGYSVEESLRLARINAENSRLDSSLKLDELKSLSAKTFNFSNLELIATNLVLPKKGILAADESGGSIHKKFEQLNIPDTYENRRDYRNIFFTTNNLEDYINGVILFDETTKQLADDGQNFVDFLTSKRIIPGIKVDQGLEKFKNSEETYTKGLDNLDSRLHNYYKQGLRFAKWRSAFNITKDSNGNLLTPTHHAISENCRILAEYASKCQSANIVPIVEPELVYDGNYTIDQSAEITSQILDNLFSELKNHHVNLKACILKINMILAGKQYEQQSTPEEVGIKTAQILKSHVPEELAGIVFLSGGQTPEQATNNLAEITKNGPFPWPVTFSFARALQDPALYAWNGNNDNTEKARQAFKSRLEANCNALRKTDNK